MQWQELCAEMERFEEGFYSRFHCDPDSLTAEKIKSSRCREALLSEWVIEFAKVYTKSKCLILTAATTMEELNSNLSKSQEKVIALQEDLIKIKDEQLAAVQTTVKNEVASVQSAVKSEISSWSKIVQQTNSLPITPTKLKEAVKSAVDEEDRSRNIMIFGKEENENEDLAQTISEIFEDMKEKPRVMECRRVGTAINLINQDLLK